MDKKATCFSGWWLWMVLAAMLGSIGAAVGEGAEPAPAPAEKVKAVLPPELLGSEYVDTVTLPMSYNATSVSYCHEPWLTSCARQSSQRPKRVSE